MRRIAAATLVAAIVLTNAVTNARGPSAAATRTATTLVVVVGAQSPLRDISRNTLRRVFLGEVTEERGIRLVALNQPPGNPARVTFDRALLGLEPEEVARFWIDQRIRGQGSAPRGIPTVSLLLRVLAQLPGGVSYARPSDIAAGVKVITVDGKTPGDAGYFCP